MHGVYLGHTPRKNHYMNMNQRVKQERQHVSQISLLLQTPKENHLRGVFILAHSLRGVISSWQKGTSYIMVARKWKENTLLVDFFCSPVQPIWTSAYKMVLSKPMMTFLYQVLSENSLSYIPMCHFPPQCTSFLSSQKLLTIIKQYRFRIHQTIFRIGD